MGEYSKLVDLILETDDYLSVLMEVKTYNIKTLDEFINVIKDLDERVKKKNIDTQLDINPDDPNVIIRWFVDQGYMNDKNRLLQIKSFDNGKVECDKSARFRAPGSVNVNELKDANQLLNVLERYLYQLEREDPKQNNSNNNEKSDDEKTPEEKEDANFELDPSVKTILDNLKTTGDDLIKKFTSAAPLEYNGKKYKIDKGKLMASTEKELIVALEFPRDQELDIYDTTSKDNIKKAQDLRRSLIKHYSKVSSKNTPEFRLDMDKNPYFYAVVGRLPVKNSSGPEARAILNYYDGNKIRFQPKER